MTTATREKIIEYIQNHDRARVHELVTELDLGNAAIHRQLLKLINAGILEKVGSPPTVFYQLATTTKQQTISARASIIDAKSARLINQNFLHITPGGQLLYGMEGFTHWINLYQRNKPIVDLANTYANQIKESEKTRQSGGWIDVTNKMKQTFVNDSFVDDLMIQDYYSYPVFGRTKLAKLVMYAKQTSEKTLILEIVKIIKPTLENIIKQLKIDSLSFVPPTVPRPVQFQVEVQRFLNLNIPYVTLSKVKYGSIPVAQKTLTSLPDRVENARKTIYVSDIPNSSYNNILIIDDVVGSGASFNEVARKIKGSGTQIKKVFAFAIVGNPKGYDVIREI